MDIQQKLINVKNEIPQGIRLVAVSKYHPTEAILEAYNSGQRIFGENKAQEMKAKHEVLPKDIQWHFIGHLQSNKIKYIISYVSMIEAVDTFKLLSEINQYAEKEERIVPCLLEIHLAKEETKFGFSFQECRDLLKEGYWKELKNVTISGIMGMASNIDDENQILREFTSLKKFFDELKSDFFSDNPNFKEISMGMSNDYKLAIQAGSTLVRIGTKIFGERL